MQDDVRHPTFLIAQPRRKSLRQVDAALGGLGVSAVKKGGVTDCTNAYASTLVRNLSAERRAFVAISPQEPQFDEFVSAKLFLQFGVESRRKPAFAQFQRRFQFLAQPAEKGLLRTT